MWFNKKFSEDLHRYSTGYTLAFYTARKQMIPLKYLAHRGFQQIKKLFHMGKFEKEKKEESSVLVSFRDIEPLLYLIRHDDGMDFDLSVAFNFYKFSKDKPEEFKDINTEGEIIYYLYRVYELGGFAQFNILGKPYLAKTEALRDYQADLILVLTKNKEYGVIGKQK